MIVVGLKVPPAVASPPELEPPLEDEEESEVVAPLESVELEDPSAEPDVDVEESAVSGSVVLASVVKSSSGGGSSDKGSPSSPNGTAGEGGGGGGGVAGGGVLGVDDGLGVGVPGEAGGVEVAGVEGGVGGVGGGGGGGGFVTSKLKE